MKIEVVMPKMGESIQEGKILQWLKKVGDKIERDEIILEISTDKVDTEVPSPNAGILTRILAPEGETVAVGSVIAEIETEATATILVSAPIPAAVIPAPVSVIPAPITVATSGGNATEVVMPKMGESIQEGKILQWLKKVGDKIERDEIILEISTDKVDTEIPSPIAGTLVEILANEGDVVAVGAVIAKISSGATLPVPAPIPIPATSAPIASAPSASVPVTVTTPVQRVSGKHFYSPLVRTIAKTENISLEELDSMNGTGIDNRVTKNDVLGYLELKKSGKIIAVSAPVLQSVKVSPTPAVLVPTPKVAPAILNADQIYAKYGKDIEIIPMDNIRQIIAEHMVYSKSTSAHVTSVMEADVTGIVKAREKNKNEFERREGIKLTYTPFFAKAAVDGIRAFPRVNVSVEGKNIIRHKHINVGMATALDNGNLIVPVIKDADSLGVTGLQRAITDMANRARNKKLLPMEIQGGTFTVTNVGTFGTLFGTPVINQPQVAIMGIGAIQRRPVVRVIGGEELIVIRSMVYVSLNYDHRVVDGMLAGQCLAAIVKSLEAMNENTVSL